MLQSLVRRKRRKVPGGPGLDPERFRVFAVACCPRVWDHLSEIMQNVLRHLERDPEDQEPNTRALAWQIHENEAERLGSQWAGEMAQILGGQANYRRLLEIDVQRWACAAVGYAARIKPYHAAVHAPRAAARAVGMAEFLVGFPSGQPVSRSTYDRDRESAAERRAQAGVLRDVFGNPFRPAAFDATWRTDTVVSLAQRMSEERRFPAMPILADALQDAGCENAVILAHCRDPKGVHVRGCWVVDLVLGK